MEPCTVEIGLLRKKPCGHPSVAKCANCEQPLCTKHAIPQVAATGRKTGTFLCAQCNASAKLYEQTTPVAAPAASPAATPATQKAAPPVPKPAAPAQKAAAPAAKAMPTAEKKPEPSPDDTSAPLEFTPSKKPEPPKK